LNQNISLWELIAKKPTVFLVDLDDNLPENQLLVTTISELPDSYMPAKDSFFKAEYYHSYALELKNKLTKKEQAQNKFAASATNFRFTFANLRDSVISIFSRAKGSPWQAHS
jgi:hypothetical protein